jgi:hypothetical protein
MLIQVQPEDHGCEPLSSLPMVARFTRSILVSRFVIDDRLTGDVFGIHIDAACR